MSHVSSTVFKASVFTLLQTFVLFCSSQVTKDSQPPTAVSQQPKTAPATEAILSSYEGQQVTGVQIAGQPSLKTEDFAPQLLQRKGVPFSLDKVQQTIAALKAKGGFKEVRLEVNPEPQGVRVLFVLEPAVYFGLFSFPGAERFPFSRLVQVSNFPPQSPFNADDIAVDRDNLLNFFRQEGYFQATVTPEIQIDQQHGLANVIFRTDLKKRAKFGELVFSGLQSPQAADLDHSLKTIVARARGSAIRPGKTYHHSTLNKATTSLQNRLIKQNHLSARVQLEGAEYLAETNRANIHFNVHPGPLVNVVIDGAHLWSWTKRSLLPMYQGVGVDPESVQEGRQALVSYFQAKGYFDVGVSSDFTHKPDPGGITITYRIEKKEKHKVSSVLLAGNTTLPRPDLESRVVVKKAHLFTHGSYSEKLVSESVKNLEDVYKSEGFSSVKVVPHVSRTAGNVSVSFDVTEGPRDIVNSLRIEGANTLPQAKFAPAGLKLEAGRPYSQRSVEADRASIGARYLEEGYLTSSFRQEASVVSKSDPHHINVIYHIYEGPRVFAGKVVTLGRNQTKQKLIDLDVNPYIQTAEPLTESHLLTAESKLFDHTGVFDWAEIDPRRPVTTQEKEDVLVKVHEGKRNQLTYGFGFELINRGGSVPSGTVALPNLPPVGLPSSYRTNQKTFYGPRGTLQYTRNNFRGKGESLSFTAFAGRLDQRLAAYYINPSLRWSQWKSTLALSAERDQQNPIFSSQQELASYQLQRFLDKKKSNTLFLRYGYSHTKLTRVELEALVPIEDRNVRLSTLAANFTHDTRDNVLDEHKGMLDSIELDYNTTKLGSSVDFAKLTAQAAYYKPLFHRKDLIWANSIRIGLAQPLSGSRVPLSEKFFSGGGNSLRGFPLNSAGPQQPVCIGETGNSVDCGSNPNAPRINVPTGGNQLLLINSEIRFPLGIKEGLGMVAFYDGGNVFSTVGFRDFTSLYSNNIGIGLRYATPVGPVRIDLGRNLNPIPGINATQYFISIGQAF